MTNVCTLILKFYLCYTKLRNARRGSNVYDVRSIYNCFLKRMHRVLRTPMNRCVVRYVSRERSSSGHSTLLSLTCMTFKRGDDLHGAPKLHGSLGSHIFSHTRNQALASGAYTYYMRQSFAILHVCAHP